MAKNDKAIYAPGELGRVREKLGVTDDAEAKRMAQLLGGQVGTERNPETDESRGKTTRRETVDVAVIGKSKRRRIDLVPPEDEKSGSSKKQSGPYPGDDPSIPLKLGYVERIKMDQYAGQITFEIKSPLQVLKSTFSFFSTPVDYVNSRFVTIRMNEYYNKLERLVTDTRNLFPRNNKKRNFQLKRASPFVYKILDILRGWNIEQIAQNISQLQSHPRSVKVSDFTEVLRGIYKPLFLLDDLNTENIKTAFKLIYKILYIESPMDAKDRYQTIIRNIIISLNDIRRSVQFGLFPLLLKLISDRFIVYERIFIERRRRFIAFLNIAETDQLNSEELNHLQIDAIDVEALNQDVSEEEMNAEVSLPLEESELLREIEEDLNDPEMLERQAKEEVEKAQQKSMDQGKNALETLFPKAGWDKLDEFPDLYPYFAKTYNLKNGYELIARTDPLQQVAVLLHILDDLFIGMRSVNFGSVTTSEGDQIKISDEIGETFNNWRSYIQDGFSRNYLPRLMDYCRMIENSSDARLTPFAKKITNELHWLKRLYFLPYYKFDSIGPPPFSKNDVVPIYSEIRKLRLNLTAIAKGIEAGVRAGGAANKSPCAGINNPWEAYNFQVPNPISKRMDLMFPPEKRMNATLIFFSLSAITVLDHIVNNEASWSYGNRPGVLFRSLKEEGITPLFGVDSKIDADTLFKESLKKTG